MKLYYVVITFFKYPNVYFLYHLKVKVFII